MKEKVIDFLKNISLANSKPLSGASLKNFLWIFLVCLAEVSLLLLFVSPMFETNDDSTMNKIASGSLSGNPSEYLVYINVIIGNILKQFYTILPHINWYVWFFIFAFFLSYVVIQYCFNKTLNNLWVKIIIHLLIFGLLVKTLLILQFTRIAGVTIVSGLLLMLFADKDSKWENLLGVLLIVLGSAIRFKLFLLIIALVIPFFIFKAKRYTFVYLGIALFCSIICFGFHTWTYQSNKELKSYIEFNDLRGAITSDDYPGINYENKKEIVSTIGWTKADFEVATEFCLDVNHPKFSDEKLALVGHNSETLITKTFSIEIFKSFESLLGTLFRFFNSRHLYVFYFIVAFIILIASRNKIPYILLYFLYLILITFFLNYYMGGNLKDRVLFGISLPFFLFLLYSADLINIAKFKYNKILFSALVIISLFSIVKPVYSYSIREYKMFEERVKTDSAKIKFLSQVKDEFYVSLLDLKNYPLFDTPPDQSKIYNLGWLVGSPFNKAKMERYTGQKDLGIYTIYNKDIVWYFANNYSYKLNTSISEFYLSNNSNCTLQKDTFLISKADTIFRFVFFIKQPVDSIASIKLIKK